MARALAGVAAVLLAAALPSAAAPAATKAPAAKPAKQVKRLCPKRARCAVLRRHRGPVVGGPLERLLGVGPGPSTGPAPAPAQPGDRAPDAPALPRFVSVAAREFSLTLSRPLVGAGAVTVELRNSGEDPHNLVVSPEGTHTPLASFSEIGPGTYERRSVSLAPGRYQLWCSLESHEGLGLSTTLNVQ
jgi:hypothetical protein